MAGVNVIMQDLNVLIRIALQSLVPEEFVALPLCSGNVSAPSGYLRIIYIPRASRRYRDNSGESIREADTTKYV
jgi:hypothetical protein